MYVPAEKAPGWVSTTKNEHLKKFRPMRRSNLVPVPIEKLPEPEEYNYVLQKYVLSLRTPVKWSCYMEATHSVVVEMNDVVAHTIFLKMESSAEAAQNQMWFDCTEEFKKWYMKNIPKPTSPPQQEIRQYLIANNPGAWYSKKEILRNTKVPDSQWRTAMKALQDKGLVIGDGPSMKRKYKLAEENG